ncbi:hypothetical protein L593_05115 [Salinarchaeum sp. Harcht-Bsk1]|nr:hypothetical protein L593_05115 [Salinarchaeum sp. Harcht-Bsk1]
MVFDRVGDGIRSDRRRSSIGSEIVFARYGDVESPGPFVRRHRTVPTPGGCSVRNPDEVTTSVPASTVSRGDRSP